MSTALEFLDPLYGECALAAPIEDLSQQPIVQRLRQIRLSNIDSLSMPGIANVSRYEHSLGTAVIAARVGFRNLLSDSEQVILPAAALLHDSAIPPFGHLVEEAFQYVSAGVNHEERWSSIFAAPEAQDLGGISLQIFMGRQSGLHPWSRRLFAHRSDKCLKEILDTINGAGRFGRVINGDLDLDNLDNVTRAAFHMGIDVDTMLPLRIAEAMVAVDEDGGIVFSRDAKHLIEHWLKTRKQVYSRFMLSRPDFAGKAMIIHSTIQAYLSGEFEPKDWTLTDFALIERLCQSKIMAVTEPVSSWLCGELWPLSDLVWMSGKLPTYPALLEFSDRLSKELDRPCIAYGIRDKRARAVSLKFDNGEIASLGSDGSRWLLAVCSALRRNFTLRENRRIVEAGCKFHSATCLGRAEPWGAIESGNTLFHE